jgi:uncharacterized phage-associated protein
MIAKMLKRIGNFCTKMLFKIKWKRGMLCKKEGNYMANISDLAHAFLSIEPMTNKKLQKLCFYAKAWYLALNDDNLISEDFEAWVHGPVCPSLYHEYKEYRFSKIPLFSGDADSIPEEFTSFAQMVFKAYGDLTGDQLEDVTHIEDPWKNARCGLKPWESCSTVITEQDMKDYYRKILAQ